MDLNDKKLRLIFILEANENKIPDSEDLFNCLIPSFDFFGPARISQIS